MSLIEGPHPSRDEVGTTDEVGDKAMIGVEIDLLRIADLDDAAGAHDRNLIRERQSLHPVVGDVDSRDLEFREKAAQFLAGGFPQLGIEIAEGLIEQNDLGLGHERARQGHALLLAAAEVGGRPLFKAFELHELKHLRYPASDFLLGYLPVLQGVGHVVEHVHVRPDGVSLKDHPESPLFRRQIDILSPRPDDLAADGNLPRIRGFESHNAAQQRGLAAATGTEQGENLIGGNSEIDLVQGPDSLAFRTEILGNALDAYVHDAPQPWSRHNHRRSARSP